MGSPRTGGQCFQLSPRDLRSGVTLESNMQNMGENQVTLNLSFKILRKFQGKLDSLNFEMLFRKDMKPKFKSD